jgi:hypothetical protein
MSLCDDQLTKELHSKNFSVVRLPRTNIRPLDLYAIGAAQRPSIGRVQDLWKSDRPQDVITVDEGGAAAITVTETGKLRCGVGVNLLSGAFEELGVKSSKLRSEYEKAKFIKITFNQPRSLRANVAQLGKYLAAGDLDWRNPVVNQFLLLGGTEVIVVSEVLQSTSISVEAFADRTTVVDLNATAIEQLGTADLKIQADKQRRGVVSYAGKEPVTFAFKAFRLAIVDGLWTLEGIDPSAELSGKTTAPAKERGPLDPDGLTDIG